MAELSGVQKVPERRGSRSLASSICAQAVLAAGQHECSQAGHRGARGSQAWRSGHLGHSCAGKSPGLGESGDLGARPSQPPTAGPSGQVTSSLFASADSNKGVRRPLLPRTRTSHLRFNASSLRSQGSLPG